MFHLCCIQRKLKHFCRSLIQTTEWKHFTHSGSGHFCLDSSVQFLSSKFVKGMFEVIRQPDPIATRIVVSLYQFRHWPKPDTVRTSWFRELILVTATGYSLQMHKAVKVPVRVSLSIKIRHFISLETYLVIFEYPVRYKMRQTHKHNIHLNSGCKKIKLVLITKMFLNFVL